MAEYPAPLAFIAARSRAVAAKRLSWRAAWAGAFLLSAPAAHAQSAQSQGAKTTPSASRLSSGPVMSRPRWEVNGSSIAPAPAFMLPERGNWTSAPRASHAWADGRNLPAVGIRLASVPQLSSRPGLGARTVTAPMSARSSEPTVTMSVTAPGASSIEGPVTMRIEVPTPSSSSTGNGVFGTRPNFSRDTKTAPATEAPSNTILSERDRARLEAQQAIERQKQFELAQANKKRLEAEAIADTLADSERVFKRNRTARADLAESVRDLNQFRGILQKAFMEAGPDATGLNPFVRTAQRYAGTPYVWGGESKNGFDCSGFIIVVLRDLGYKSPPHSAALQFNYGMPVARGLLKPGDLVFFQNTYKPGISHVGIYLGGGRFIHAAGTGKGTIVSHLSSSPFAQKYAGARRLFRNRA